MGLSDGYMIVRSQLLMMNQLPTFQAYSLINQEETQTSVITNTAHIVHIVNWDMLSFLGTKVRISICSKITEKIFFVTTAMAWVVPKKTASNLLVILLGVLHSKQKQKLKNLSHSANQAAPINDDNNQDDCV